MGSRGPRTLNRWHSTLQKSPGSLHARALPCVCTLRRSRPARGPSPRPAQSRRKSHRHDRPRLLCWLSHHEAIVVPGLRVHQLFFFLVHRPATSHSPLSSAPEYSQLGLLTRPRRYRSPHVVSMGWLNGNGYAWASICQSDYLVCCTVSAPVPPNDVGVANNLQDLGRGDPV